MHRLLHRLVCSVVLIVASGTVAAAQATQPVRMTLERSADLQPIKASVADLSWLEGHWRGEALGGRIEETWTAPSGGSMLGMFKHVKDGRTVFYEIFAIVPDSGGVALRLKHFHADLRGWEEKNDVRRFVLLRLSPNAAQFDGMTYALQGRDTLKAIVAMRQPDGRVLEETFVYHRVPGSR